jgi:hypothetical protein
MDFGAMKAALLAVEAALLLGSVDHSESGLWGPEFPYSGGRSLKGTGGNSLRCVILLEECHNRGMVEEDISPVMPAKQMEAMMKPSALAVRIILLDRAILYGRSIANVRV